MFQPKGERGKEFYAIDIYDLATMPPYQIGMEEWRTSQTPLATYAVATCVVVAAVNTEWRTALLGHFAAPGNQGSHGESQLFENALAELPNLGPAGNTSIRLAGARILPQDTDGDAQERVRAYSEMRVREAAEAVAIPEQMLAVEWLQDHYELSARVNPYLGKITIRPSDPV